MTNPPQGSDEETPPTFADMLSHVETCTHMNVTSTDPDESQQWHARRNKARLALLSRVDSLESALREAQKDRDAVIRECANVADAELRALYAEYRDTHRDEQECAQAIRNNILGKLSEFSAADTGEST